MTLQSEGSRSLLAYCEEPDGWGQVPVPSRNWTGYRFNRESLGLEINQFESAEIRSDAETSSVSRGNRRPDGDTTIEFGTEGHNLLLRHLLRSSWGPPTGGGPYVYGISGGNALITSSPGLTFVKGFTDQPYYLVYPGGRVDSMVFENPQEGNVTATVRLLFKEEQDGVSSAPYSGVLAYPEGDPYESNLTEIAVVAYDANATGIGDYDFSSPLAVGTSVRFTISNTADAGSYVLRSYSRYSIPLGRRRIEGSFNILFVDDTEYERYKNGTALAMQVKFTNGASGASERYHKFVFPNIRYNGSSATPRIEGEAGVRQDIPFRAVRHPGFGTSVYVEARTDELITYY